MPSIVGPLSDDFFIALGKVGADFAMLENQVAFLTWSLISQDQRLGQIITAELSFRALRALLSSIFRHRVQDTALIDELEKLLDRAAAVEERRNIVVHSSWGAGESAATRTRIKMTGRCALGPGSARPRVDRTDHRHLHAPGPREARSRRRGAQSISGAIRVCRVLPHRARVTARCERHSLRRNDAYLGGR